LASSGIDSPVIIPGNPHEDFLPEITGRNSVKLKSFEYYYELVIPSTSGFFKPAMYVM